MPEGLVHRNAGQELPDVIGFFHLEFALLGAGKKGAKDRLHNVLRVQAAAEALADALPGQAEEPLLVYLEQFAGGVFIAVAPAVEQDAGLR